MKVRHGFSISPRIHWPPLRSSMGWLVSRPTSVSRLQLRRWKLPDVDAAWDALTQQLDRRLPLSEAINRYMATLDPVHARAQFAIDANLVLEACLPVEQLSVCALDERGRAWRWMLPGGYSELVDLLAKDLDIRLNTPVTQIDWSSARQGE
jgi:hypothetical protein